MLFKMLTRDTSCAKVVVATGEVVRSALESGQLNAQQLACVVLDEAHYAVGRALRNLTSCDIIFCVGDMLQTC